ncbi:hypothetical protein KSF78_0008311 [Schistosoma japonicum]|nr:hypothetical protein KSF78_0008311 [Schistosoma japonicum]
MLRISQYFFITFIVSLLLKSFYSSFLKNLWENLIIYKWLRSCLLDTNNLREVFYPKHLEETQIDK